MNIRRAIKKATKKNMAIAIKGNERVILIPDQPMRLKVLGRELDSDKLPCWNPTPRELIATNWIVVPINET